MKRENPESYGRNRRVLSLNAHLAAVTLQRESCKITNTILLFHMNHMAYIVYFLQSFLATADVICDISFRFFVDIRNMEKI